MRRCRAAKCAENERSRGDFHRHNFYLGDSSDLTVGFEKTQREKDKHGSVKGVIQAELDPTATIGRDYARKFDVDLQKLNLTYSNSYNPQSNLLLLGYEYKDHTTFWSAPQRINLDGSTNNDVNAYTTLNDYHQDQRGIKGEWRSGKDGLGWLAGGRGRTKSTRKKFPDGHCSTCWPTTTSRAPDSIRSRAANGRYSPGWTISSSANTG